MASNIGLGELIDTVANELLEAEKRAADRSARILALDGVELTLSVAVEKQGNGGIKVYVLSIGGSKKSTDTHTIRTTFKPVGEQHVFDTDEEEPNGDGTYE
ncbi:MAG TPA: trypco2 family protein [Thermoleophilaceae bacterium]|jgi:hypothetical protein